jgi:hypothetical protein
MAQDDDPPPASELGVLDEAEDPHVLQVVQGSLDGAETRSGGGGERLVGGIAVGLAPGVVEEQDLEQQAAGALEAVPAEQLAFEGAARSALERLPVEGPGS